MKFFPLIAEAFYAPKSFFRLRRNNPDVFYFLTFFYLLAVVSLTANLSLAFGIVLNFIQFFFLVLFFYLATFLKAALFSAFLNADAPKVSLKEIWLLNALTVYPVFIFVPLGAALGHYQGFFLSFIFLTFGYVNYIRTKYLSAFYGVRARFVWIVSLSEILFVVFTLLTMAGMGLLYISTLLQEMIK